MLYYLYLKKQNASRSEWYNLGSTNTLKDVRRGMEISLGVVDVYLIQRKHPELKGLPGKFTVTNVIEAGDNMGAIYLI